MSYELIQRDVAPKNKFKFQQHWLKSNRNAAFELPDLDCCYTTELLHFPSHLIMRMNALNHDIAT